ncbi:RadC family protein [Novosphingobium mangrovi (ex Hu et al. 2023)]|uniref:RadC family protein n=1 Tax=Novosphingobium mangrovi (ex Hu et al. 2023) TaxID=2930094 RepID=UPI002E1043B7|nr:DNA repair protein RadC [Novosphingobium mangrovi (ex Hu et al. 2023)]
MRTQFMGALSSIGLALPLLHFEITIPPHAAEKEGDFELPSLLSVLGALGVIDSEKLASWICLGSLGDHGEIRMQHPGPEILELAERSSKGILGGQSLFAFGQDRVAIQICQQLNDAIRPLRPTKAPVEEPIEVEPPKSFWSKLLGSKATVLRENRMAHQTLDHEALDHPRSRTLRPYREPNPEFHGIGHRSRLRERLLDGDADSLADYEVLEFMLFGARRRGDTKPLAKALIKRFGSLPAVLNADTTALLGVPGIGPASAGVIKIGAVAAKRMARAQLRDQPIISSWHVLIDYLSIDMAHLTRERVRVLYLDKRNKLVRDEHISEGTISEASVHPREVIHHALDCGASGLILVHNHPSGNPEPSREDVDLTHSIAEAGRLMGITVQDHVIIGREGHVSLRAKGLI